MYIFGKFEGFCKQLEKVGSTVCYISMNPSLSAEAYWNTTNHSFLQITQIITAVKTFYVLGKSTIEGIDVLASEFQNIYLNVKNKRYDMWAHRKADFEVDFAEFMAHIGNLEVCLLQCCLLL